MLILLITLMSLIPLYGSLGFWIPESSGLGVRSVNEMYVLGAFYGFLLGALQSFSRVFYADFIPPGMESEFFALYEITDKGSSWLGPLMVAVVTDWLGNIRYGFVVIFLMLLLGLIPLVLLNVERGQSDARNFTIDVLANSDDDTETMVEPVAARGRANDEEVVNWQQI